MAATYDHWTPDDEFLNIFDVFLNATEGTITKNMMPIWLSFPLSNLGQEVEL